MLNKLRVWWGNLCPLWENCKSYRKETLICNRKGGCEPVCNSNGQIIGMKPYCGILLKHVKGEV